MKIIAKKVQAYQNEAHCEKCGEKMEYSGMAPTKYDPFVTYNHMSYSIPAYECKRCKTTEASYRVFPYITYEEIE